MKLGLISDIHADYYALKKAFQVLRREQVDAYVCAGDVVGKGPMPDQTVALLEYYSIPNVLGNHDQKALEQGGLRPETDRYLRASPLNRTMAWSNCKVMVAHGTPACNRSYVFAQKVPKTLEGELAGLDIDVLVLGHTHQPMSIDMGPIKVVNPGSVCRLRPYDSHTCAVLELASYALHVFAL